MKKDFSVMRYHVVNHKNHGSFRIAFLSDLHSLSYGRRQEQILEVLGTARPDAVLLGGDIVDDRYPGDGGYELFRQLGAWRSYYVTGNHEIWTKQTDRIKAFARDRGVKVLEGTWDCIAVRGNRLLIGGTDDPWNDREQYYCQLEALSRAPAEGAFSILLQHRPELVEQYLPLGFDLMLAGHAHGGQWRIPGLVNGVYAPGQGILPKYAGGQYQFEKQTLIVGRGLAKNARGIPRICNPPELVLVDVEAERQPEEEGSSSC